MQSLSFLVHSNLETGASERQSRAAVYVAQSSLSITKIKERDCVQSRCNNSFAVILSIVSYYRAVGISYLPCLIRIDGLTNENSLSLAQRIDEGRQVIDQNNRCAQSIMVRTGLGSLGLRIKLEALISCQVYCAKCFLLCYPLVAEKRLFALAFCEQIFRNGRICARKNEWISQGHVTRCNISCNKVARQVAGKIARVTWPSVADIFFMDNCESRTARCSYQPNHDRRKTI